LIARKEGREEGKEGGRRRRREEEKEEEEEREEEESLRYSKREPNHWRVGKIIDFVLCFQ